MSISSLAPKASAVMWGCGSQVAEECMVGRVKGISAQYNTRCSPPRGGGCVGEVVGSDKGGRGRVREGGSE